MERSRVGLAKDHREATTVPPSRAAALKALRAAVEAQSGPVLVTGDVGVGKTWLWRRLQDELPGPWRWVGVDLTPAIEPAAFYRLLGHGLGLAVAETVADGRIVLADFLKDRHADGDRWVLTIDEVHNASTAVWEEARVLTNRLGRPDGFAGLLLIGQTPVARRLTTRALAAVEARVSARIHLRPLDSDEARDLLRAGATGPRLGAEALERLHRDAAGNTRRLFPRGEPDLRRPDDTVDGRAAPAPAASAPFERETVWEAPLLGPSRPALQEEDGVIEVGWSPAGESETERKAMTPDLADVPVVTTGAMEGEETIDDRYAALQAWTEWARNQGRSPSQGLAAQGEGGADEARDDVPTGSAVVGAAVHGVWAEGQQGFAPYGQLFSKLRQPRDPK